MKAILLHKYGPPEQLKVEEIPTPEPLENEAQVRIKATAINDYDWSMVRGKPHIYRLMFGLSKPKKKIPGMELAGVVEKIGPGVTSLKAGDEVYGDISEYGFGSFAEYICIHEKALVIKPEGMSFEEAASIPHAAGLALQGLKDKGAIKKGQKILINGAGGGVGTFGLQFAKQYDAHVTGVDTGEKLKMMEEIGFDQVIDYRKEDFTRSGEKYDLILDAKTNRSPFAYIRSLKKDGTYATVGGSLTRMIQLLLFRKWISFSRKKHLHIVALKPNKDLDYVSQLFTSNKLKCVIDGPYPFEKTPELIRYFGEGKHSGKVVISMED